MIPENPIARASALLSAASSTRDLGARAVYLATARVLIVSHTRDVEQATRTLEAMEAELVRAWPAVSEARP